ncbi:methyltransferase [Streptomyces sp. NPDC058864]
MTEEKINVEQTTHEKSVAESADLMTPMSLRVAATLRLADLVPEEGATVAEIAALVDVEATSLGRLLDHLVTVGAFEHEEEFGRYTVTAWGRQLRSDDPHPLRPGLDLHGALGRAQLAAVELLHTVTTNGDAYSRRYGRDFWTDLAATPALRASFDATMQHRIHGDATTLLNAFDWSRFTHLVDVGGGDGLILASVLEAHPQMRGHVVERAETIAQASARLTRAVLARRAVALEGNFLDSLPEGADLYLLSDIVHNWADEEAISILSNCANAMAPHGAVVVVETMLDGEPDQPRNTGMDLNMWTFLGGRERTQHQIVDLAAHCGLHLAGQKHIGPWRNLLEFRLG